MAPQSVHSVIQGEAPLVLVCLAAYNGMQYLPEQVDTILGQEQVRVSLLISVDVSTDDTLAWCQALAVRDDRVQVLPYGTRFGGAAPNFFHLVRASRSLPFDYLSLADQDDHWLPDKLARAVGEMQARGSDGYSCDVVAFWPDGHESTIVKSGPQRPWDHFFEAAGPGCTYVMSRRLAEPLTDFLHDRATDVAGVTLHDWLIYAFARSRGFVWTIDPRPGMRYRQHAINQVGANVGWAAMQRRVQLMRSGWWLGQVDLMARLMDTPDAQVLRSLLSAGRLGAWRLALRAGQCRRRPRDRAVMAAFLVLAVLFGMPVARGTP